MRKLNILSNVLIFTGFVLLIGFWSDTSPSWTNGFVVGGNIIESMIILTIALIFVIISSIIRIYVDYRVKKSIAN